MVLVGVKRTPSFEALDIPESSLKDHTNKIGEA